MGSKEYLLLAMVILVPLVIAVAVTLWTLEQARLRSKQNRPRPAKPADLLSDADDVVEPPGGQATPG
jgi:hypothetical protein